jgi:hypothetical protein
MCFHSDKLIVSLGKSNVVLCQSISWPIWPFLIKLPEYISFVCVDKHWKVKSFSSCLSQHHSLTYTIWLRQSDGLQQKIVSISEMRSNESFAIFRIWAFQFYIKLEPLIRTIEQPGFVKNIFTIVHLNNLYFKKYSKCYMTCDFTKTKMLFLSEI